MAQPNRPTPDQEVIAPPQDNKEGQKPQQPAQGAQTQQANKEISKKRIIVRNLPPGTSRDELYELGNKYGRIIECGVIRPPKEKMNNMPYGFISFLTEDDAEFAEYRLNGFRYKEYELLAAPSIGAPKQTLKGPRRGPDNKDNKASKKVKKPIYSLRTLTPVNPPTQTPANPLPKSNNYTIPSTSNGSFQQQVLGKDIDQEPINDNPPISDVEVPISSGNFQPAGQYADPPSRNNKRFGSGQDFRGSGQGPKRGNRSQRGGRGGAFRRVQHEPDTFPLLDGNIEPHAIAVDPYQEQQYQNQDQQYQNQHYQDQQYQNQQYSNQQYQQISNQNQHQQYPQHQKQNPKKQPRIRQSNPNTPNPSIPNQQPLNKSQPNNQPLVTPEASKPQQPKPANNNASNNSKGREPNKKKNTNTKQQPNNKGPAASDSAPPQEPNTKDEATSVQVKTKDRTLNFKLSPDQLKHFLSVIEPFVQEN